MKAFLYSLILCVMGVSCSHSDGFLEKDNVLAFKPDKRLKIGSVQFRAIMKFNNDTLILRLTSSNEGSEQITLDLQRAELSLPNGSRSVPVKLSSTTLQLNAGNTSVDTLYFLPVNDLEFYNHTELNGPLLKFYSFSPSGIIEQLKIENKIALEADEIAYNSYLEINTIQDYSFYNILKSQEMQQRLENQAHKLIDFGNEAKKVLQSNNPLTNISPDVKISRKEVLINGVAIKIKAYQNEDELFVRFRIVNHQSVPLLLKPESFGMMTTASNLLLPLSIKYEEVPARWNSESSKELLKGERASMLLSFKAVEIGNITLKPSITFNEKEFLFESIELHKVTLPNQE